MIRNGLIKAFTKHVKRQKKVIGKYIPKHLDITLPLNQTLLKVVSTSAEDCIENEGAFAILLDGLDEEFTEQTEIIKLNGKTGQCSLKEFYRINNIIIIECGELKRNIGNIYVTSIDDDIINGIPQNYLYHTIGKGENMSCCGVYTVPKGYSMQFTQYNLTSKNPFFGSIINNNYISHPNFSQMEIVEVWCNHFQSNVNYPIHYATPIGEGSDLILKVRKTNFFGNSRFGCYFQFKLVPNSSPTSNESTRPAWV